jgi:uncharacterized protein YrrD
LIMRKGNNIIGRPVFAYDTGKKLDNRIADLIFDQDSNQLLGFLIDEKGWFRDAQVLPLENIHAIGPDAVIVPSAAAILRAKDSTPMQAVLAHGLVLKGSRIMTTEGQGLGTMVDLYFDEQTGAIEGYETSGGLFADAYSGRSFIPAPRTLSIGEDAVFVPPETAGMMAEQVGGIKGAVQTANQKVQDAAQAAGEQVQVATATAQANLQIAGEKASETWSQAQRNADASIANAVVDPAKQRLFVVGRVAETTVSFPDGRPLVLEGETVTPQQAEVAAEQNLLAQLYRATGGNVQEQAKAKFLTAVDEQSQQIQIATDQSRQKLQAVGQQAQDAIASQTQALNQRTQNALSSHAVEEAKGRRVQRIVRTEAGFIVAAPGQIVTERVIVQAREQRLEQALLLAVGLSPQSAAQSQANAAWTTTGDRVQATTQSAERQLRQGSEQLQTGAQGLWEEIKDAVGQLRDRSTQAVETKRIKGALGRPTTRVILDRQDNVILNTGDLITNHAIDRARQADILDLLLDSVYAGDPQISRDELRVEEAGEESLKAEPV